jgi:hypothetical protein
MDPRKWLITTISMMLACLALIAGFNAAVDIYGLYRPTTGRRLVPLGDERIAKYLLSARYVPENFNAILSGASISANWDTRGIQRLRVYNESLDGGNLIEEKAVIESALEKPGLRVAFLLVHPALTYTHEYNTVALTPALKSSALGSSSLWAAYKEWANVRFGRLTLNSDYAGNETFRHPRSEMNIHMKEMWNAPAFTVDPLAVQAQRELLAHLRAHGVQVVFIVPPTSEDLLRTKGVQMDQYLQAMRSEIGEGYLWIDFLAPEYRDLRRRTNFSDGSHLTPDAAKQVVEHINMAIARWSEEGRLSVVSK